MTDWLSLNNRPGPVKVRILPPYGHHYAPTRWQYQPTFTLVPCDHACPFVCERSILLVRDALIDRYGV